jgi:hypothetical protein
MLHVTVRRAAAQPHQVPLRFGVRHVVQQVVLVFFTLGKGACSTSAFALECQAGTSACIRRMNVIASSMPHRERKRDGNARRSSSCLFQASGIAAGRDEGLLQTANNLRQTRTRRRNRTRTILLVSLPPRTDDAGSTVRRAWKWKDSALGDGRDYFVPRPRALRALNKLLVGTTIRLVDCIDGHGGGDEGNKHKGEVEIDCKHTIEECGVLSNCARLDFVLVVSGSSNDSGGAVAAGRRAVAEALACQLVSFGSIHQRNAALDGLASLLDLAGVVDECPTSIETNAEVADFANELDGVLVTVEGGKGVCRHLCEVACGFAERPSRPGRDVPFRPWSSRDAHIMLQLKRTSEVVDGSRVKLLFDASLQSGKAARDPDKVREILPLKQFGTDGRYATAPPKELTEKAVAAATNIAIQPAIERCEAKLTAMESSEAISSLRYRVEETLQGAGLASEKDSKVGLVVRRVLHQPTMALREGKSVDEDQVISEIFNELGVEDAA